MTTYPDDVMTSAFEWTRKSYDKDTETWLDVRDNFAAAIMAERKRCYDLAHEVCENDFDHVTGELDNDIMNGVTLADKEASRPAGSRSLGLFSKVLYERKMIAQFREMAETFNILHGDIGKPE